MNFFKQSATRNVVVKLFLSSDHVTAATGKTLTVTLSKDGAAFAAAAGSVTELSSGWYKIALTTVDTNTLGALVVRATATACDDAERVFEVVAFDPQSASSLGLSNLATAVSTPPTAAAIRAEIDSNSTKLDVTIGSRLATAGYTAPASAASIAAAVWAESTRTLSSFGTLAADVWAVATRTLSAFSFGVTASTVSDKTGYSLATAPPTAAEVATAVGFTAAPTAVENADALLKRDWTGLTGEADRSVLQALRALRNKVSRSGSTLTITKEDDATSAWTAALTTDADAEPITGVDPA
jgi:hypothetical protein